MLHSVEIGKNLRDFGEKKFPSLAAFSRALGMNNPQQLQAYLKGTILLGAEKIAKLVELGCDINWLLNGKTINGDVETEFVKEPNGEYMTEYTKQLKEGNVLKEENRDLKAMIFDLQRDKEQLIKQNEKQSRIIQDLKDEIAELQKVMSKLST